MSFLASFLPVFLVQILKWIFASGEETYEIVEDDTPDAVVGDPTDAFEWPDF